MFIISHEAKSWQRVSVRAALRAPQTRTRVHAHPESPIGTLQGRRDEQEVRQLPGTRHARVLQEMCLRVVVQTSTLRHRGNTEGLPPSVWVRDLKTAANWTGSEEEKQAITGT